MHYNMQTQRIFFIMFESLIPIYYRPKHRNKKLKDER